MGNQVFRIITQEGAIVRKKATRPYKAAWIGRDLEGNVIDGSHKNFTINPCELLGITSDHTTYDNKTIRFTYEPVIAIDITSKEIMEKAKMFKEERAVMRAREEKLRIILDEALELRDGLMIQLRGLQLSNLADDDSLLNDLFNKMKAKAKNYMEVLGELR